MASSNRSSLLLGCSLVLLVFLSLCGGTDARRFRKGCGFDSIFTFGHGRPSVSNGLVRAHEVSSTFNHLSPPYKSTMFDSDSSFATPEAIVTNPSFFIKNGMQPPQVEGSLNTQIDEFVNFLGTKSLMTFKVRVKELQGSLFFINQPGIVDYKQALLQGKTVDDISKLVPEVISAIKDHIRKLVFSGASKILISGVPRSEFSRFSHKLEGLDMFVQLHNDFIQQAIFELKFEFPKVDIVYANYNKMLKGLFRETSPKSSRSSSYCRYFQHGDLPSHRHKAVLA